MAHFAVTSFKVGGGGAPEREVPLEDVVLERLGAVLRRRVLLQLAYVLMMQTPGLKP